MSAADAPGTALFVGLAGAGLVAAGLVLRRGAVATVGLAFVGGGYAVSLVGKGLDPAASLFAGALVLVAELAYWALEPGAPIRVGRAASGRRLAASGAIALGAVGLGAVLLAAASSPLRGDVGLGIAGVVGIGVITAAVVGLLHALR
jgi:hypothetical protein